MKSKHTRRRVAQLALGADAASTSIDSDASVPSTPDVPDGAAARPRFDLDEAFPAILAPLSLLHRIPESQDIVALRALAPVFSHCLDAILHSMVHLPEDMPTSPKYHLALRAVAFAKDAFLDHVKRIDDRPPFRRGGIHTMMQLLDMTMSALKSFLNVAAYEAAQLKPLPQAPVADDLIQATDDSDAVSQSHSSGESHHSGSNPSTLASRSTDALERSKISALFKPLPFRRKVRKMSSCLHSAGPDSAASSTLVDSDEDLGRGYVFVSVDVRNSLAHFPVSIDPTTGAIPHPEDATELWKDHNGLAQLASLKALVRYMTSSAADSDVEIVDVFFLCFRFFSSPQEVFHAFLARYDEDLTGLSLSTTRSHSMQVKIRIARLLYLWVDLHWREEDAKLLTPLTQFAISRLTQDLPREASLKLVSSLHERACAGENARGVRKEKTIARAEAKYRQELLSSTWEPREKKSMLRRDFSRVKLEHFHSPGGHAMLGLQMTLFLWEKYRAFEPEDAVRYLITRDDDRNSPQSKIALQVANFMDYEKAVHRFVMSSIGSAESEQRRTALTEFFLELASKCHELRNYSASCLIALACDRPSILPFITKLKLSPAHERMRTNLREFYTQNNHHLAGYKEALQSCSCPALPGMMLFIREVARGCGTGPYQQHPEFPSPPLINLRRYRPITWAVRAMEKCHAPFRIQRVDYVCDWLEHVLSEYLVGTEEEWESRIQSNCRALKQG